MRSCNLIDMSGAAFSASRQEMRKLGLSTRLYQCGCHVADSKRYMSKQKRTPGDRLKEAQQWAQVLENAGPEERHAFGRWIRRSPQHLEAYLQHLAVHAELQGLDANHEYDIEALLAKAATNVIDLASAMPQTEAPMLRDPAPGKWRLLLGGVAAACILVVVCLIAQGAMNDRKWIDYVTDTGEHRRIVLRDGSSIELNTQTHIRVSPSLRSREIELLKGEALFDVRHDAARPFRVHFADRVVEDLGTQFSIYLRPDTTTTVSVIDGSVQIGPSSPSTSGHQLSAGEQVRIAADGTLGTHTAISVKDAVPWREHQLWFEGAGLTEVAGEFNRYNKRQIHISEEAARLNRRYTATFDAYDPDSFVQALEDDPELIVRRNESEMLVQTR